MTFMLHGQQPVTSARANYYGSTCCLSFFWQIHRYGWLLNILNPASFQQFFFPDGPCGEGNGFRPELQYVLCRSCINEEERNKRNEKVLHFIRVEVAIKFSNTDPDAGQADPR